jgi:tetratricopeptide (TPR) repeat protein
LRRDWDPSTLHPRTVNNLGLLYKKQGRLEDVDNCALAGTEKVLGPEHTSTLDTVNNLGLLHKKQGRLEDAERMFDRALAGIEKALGLGYTVRSTLKTIEDLCRLYESQGRIEDAERMRDHMHPHP